MPYKEVNKFGFVINNEIIFMRKKNSLINITEKKTKIIKLRPTMSNFINYMLEQRNSNFISDNDLLTMIWEENNLQASTQRLWQVVRDVKYKLIDAGLELDLFNRVERSGYVVNKKIIVELEVKQ